jgi:hypothetical protein
VKRNRQTHTIIKAKRARNFISACVEFLPIFSTGLSM